MPPKENEVELSELYALEEQVEDLKYALYDARKQLKNAIIIPEGATNGDMIKAMFPNSIITICSEAKPTPYVMVIGEHYEFNNTYPLDWWNAPYRKVEE